MVCLCVAFTRGWRGLGGRLRLRNGIIRLESQLHADSFIKVYFHYAKRSILSVNFEVNFKVNFF